MQRIPHTKLSATVDSNT